MAEVVVVTGGGGFIGGHLVKRLVSEGKEVVSIDIKPIRDWYQISGGVVNIDSCDLSKDMHVNHAFGGGISEVYHLACDMGGMGFLAGNRVACLHSVDITSNVMRKAYESGAERIFYSSSACVYADYKQQTEVVSLKESDAWPADPEPAYGLEKLYGEEFCKWYAEEGGLITRVARYHNSYGPKGTYSGGREKAPAAICRKVIEAKLSGKHEIDIWGDGEQTRSFMYIDDCIEGTRRIMDSDIRYPINLGSSELVTINQLVSMVEEISGVTLEREYNLDAPQGVRGRNSDNTLIKKELDWEPSIGLREGLEATYEWILAELTRG